MSDLTAMNLRAPAGQRLPWRWLKRPVMNYQGKVGELRRLLPVFQRRYGRCGEHEIVRTGLNLDDRVVGRVSPDYILVQHHELLDVLPDVLAAQGYDLDDLLAELSLTIFGERMELVIDLPALKATPPDGYPLACRLRCLNSVDRTTSIEAELQWYRQICSNGMFGWAGERVRRIHRFDEALAWVQRNLYRRFQELPSDREFFIQLSETSVRPNDLRDWADVFVAREWGRPQAARVLHICRTGKDGTVETHAARGFPEHADHRPAHAMEVISTADVPGACAPASNLYHVGQALSWVGGQATALHTRFSRVAEVPKLLRHLMN